MKNLLPFAYIAIIACTIQACSSTQSATGTDTSSTNVSAIRLTSASETDRSGATNQTEKVENDESAHKVTFGNTDIPVTSGIAYTNALYEENQDQYSGQDSSQQFIRQAGMSGVAELQLSQIALKRAQDPAVKSFASMMVKDHKMINKALKSLADSKHLAIPDLDISTYANRSKPGQDTVYKKNTSGNKGTANRNDMGINEKMNKLVASPDKQFDQQYIKMMVTDHQKAISLFEQGTKSNDVEIKAFATKHLPILRTHQKIILALNAKTTAGNVSPN